MVLGYIVLAALIVLGWAGLATVNYVGRTNNDQTKTELDNLVAQNDANAALVSQATFVEDRTQNATKYQSDRNWDELLGMIAESVPTENQLTSIKIVVAADKQPTLNISGQTSDRRSVVLFKDKLAASESFADVSIGAINQASADSGKQFTYTISASLAKHKK